MTVTLRQLSYSPHDAPLFAAADRGFQAELPFSRQSGGLASRAWVPGAGGSGRGNRDVCRGLSRASAMRPLLCTPLLEALSHGVQFHVQDFSHLAE